MYDQTNHADTNAALVLLAPIWLTAYIVLRTGRVVRTLAPVWAQRIRYDLSVAAKTYAGTNVTIINLDTPEPQIDRYHTRYEGTDRAASDEGSN
jgi:hypothetical protein